MSFCKHSHINTHVEELVGRQVSGADLKPVDVHVYHGVAEVGLDVRHRLALDLQTVPHPHARQDLVEQALRWTICIVRETGADGLV